MTDPAITKRLEYIRGELRAERISYGELVELQGLVTEIDPGDVELLEAAGMPEPQGGITPEGQALGHRYVMGHINAYCPQCTKEQGITVLDCDFDLDK